MKTIIIMIICIFLFSSACSATNIDETNVYSLKDTIATKSLTVKDTMEVYYVSRDVFPKFISNPSTTFLEKTACSYDRYTMTNENTIQSEMYDQIGYTMYEDQLGSVYIDGYLPLYPSLIKFVTNHSELEQFLLKHGFQEKVMRAALICTTDMPICIWISTEERDYYATVTANASDKAGTVSYIYDIYTPLSFVNLLLHLNSQTQR